MQSWKKPFVVIVGAIAFYWFYLALLQQLNLKSGTFPDGLVKSLLEYVPVLAFMKALGVVFQERDSPATKREIALEFGSALVYFIVPVLGFWLAAQLFHVYLGQQPLALQIVFSVILGVPLVCGLVGLGLWIKARLDTALELKIAPTPETRTLSLPDAAQLENLGETPRALKSAPFPAVWAGVITGILTLAALLAVFWGWNRDSNDALVAALVGAVMLLGFVSILGEMRPKGFYNSRGIGRRKLIAWNQIARIEEIRSKNRLGNDNLIRLWLFKDAQGKSLFLLDLNALEPDSRREFLALFEP